MTTLATMKARIASELARTDLGTQIADAINTAIATYQTERFRFSDVIPSTVPTFPTVNGRFIYTAVDNANIGSMFKVDYLLAEIGGSLSRLTYLPPGDIRQYNQLGTMHGQPMWWSYEGNQILLGPTPDAVYTITMGLFRSVPAPALDSEPDNPWMLDGEELIRSRAKYEIALHVTRNKDMQAAMSPFAPPGGQTAGHASYFAWKRLKGVANRVTSSGRVRAMAF